MSNEHFKQVHTKYGRRENVVIPHVCTYVFTLLIPYIDKFFEAHKSPAVYRPKGTLYTMRAYTIVRYSVQNIRYTEQVKKKNGITGKSITIHGKILLDGWFFFQMIYRLAWRISFLLEESSIPFLKLSSRSFYIFLVR